MQKSNPLIDPAAIRWRFARLATAFKAQPGDVLRYHPNREPGQRYTIERAAQLHEGMVDKLGIEEVITPLGNRTVLDCRRIMVDVVTADSLKREAA